HTNYPFSSHNPVTKLLAARTSAKEEIDKATHDLYVWQEAFKKQYDKTLASVAKSGERSDADFADLQAKTDDMAAEVAK
ncbi:hypothetical protein, partial [Klebsiella quasipneumoniae]|uniref:hypothetical protein n=1 Tax=Klebsiella quasipneumoniae TaxID=1463165 RepID=UPI001940316D